MQASGRQSITVEDSMSMVHASSGLVEPPTEHLKSEVAIVCGMAKATLPDCGIDWDFYAADSTSPAPAATATVSAGCELPAIQSCVSATRGQMQNIVVSP